MMSWKDRESDIWQLYPTIGRFVLGYNGRFLEYNSKMMNTKRLNNKERGKRNIHAAGYMLVAALLYAMMPVFVTLAEGHKAPFMYNAIGMLFACIGASVFLIVFYRRQVFDREIWHIICQNWRRWSLLGVVLGAFSYAIFAWSLRYIDVSVAAVLYETWPFFMILLTGKMFQTKNRYESVGAFGWACILMGFVGLGFVISSQTEEADAVKETMPLFHLFLGVLLALISAGLAAMHGGCSLRWGAYVLEDIPEHKQKETDRDLTMLFVLAAIVFTGIPSITISVALGAWGGHNEIVEFDNMIIAAFLGFFVVTTALILFRVANLATTKLETNAMGYATPIFTLAYLAILGYINIPKTDWLVIGAMGVIAANALLNFKAERRLAYQSLVVALWGCGVIVYFRSFFHAPVFYETVAVVTTMFILILSFRIDRLVRRTSDEDKLTLEIWQKISLLPKYLQDKLCEIDEAKTAKELGEAHKDFRNSLKTECADDKEFSDIMQQVNILSHSKQQGDNFGEHAVLWILGGVSAGGLLFFMPEGVNAESGAGGFFLEMAAFLVSATVIFLLFNIQDLQQDRRHQVLRTKSDTENPDEKNKHEGLVFREDQDRTAARRISIVFCVGIVATFGILFWLKWMPI